jgi:phenylacetate-coenzyme A ligase PaaK-like adenylate-forming protein
MKERTPLSVAWDAWLAKRAGLPGILDRQQKRLNELVAFAREHSPYYAGIYRNLPARVDDIQQLPPVTKTDLMAHFEEWVTDPAIKRADVDAFIADKSRIGDSFLSRYLVFTTSGSSGMPAILIQDALAQAVMTGLTYVRGLSMVSPREYWQVFRKGGRQAALFATGGHFLGVTMIERRRHARPWRTRMSRIISVLTPLPEIVKELNEFQPAMVGGYATMLILLVEEQEAGRLHIDPALITSSGETLSPQSRKQIETAFGCTVTESYGCSEATPLTITCRHQRLHVNSDWFILEAVNKSYEPVPAGQHSHTVLITNLANHVQPIIRYELGDSVTVDPDPCPCGSPLPSVQVIGRTDEILSFLSRNGMSIRVLPLALWSVIKETPGVLRFQAIQTGPAKLSIRLEAKKTDEMDSVWQILKQRVHDYLATQELTNVLIERDVKLPTRDPRSGKFRHVWAELPQSRPEAESQILAEQ